MAFEVDAEARAFAAEIVLRAVRRRIAIALAVGALACAGAPQPPRPPLDHTERNYTLGLEVHAAVGSPFITAQRTQKHWYRTNAGQWFSEGQVDRHELLYSGRDGNTLLVAYREYSASNDDADLYARPAYSQELRYNLDASDLVVFRDYRIRVVVEATNEAIRVVVLSDGSAPTPSPAHSPRASPAP